MPDFLFVGDQQTSNYSFRQFPIFREVLASTRAPEGQHRLHDAERERQGERIMSFR
jgi:hypothetical protein